MRWNVGEAPQAILPCGNDLGECVLWDEREAALWWVNIHDKEVWRWNPFSGERPRTFELPERVGALALRERGGLVLALESGFALFEPSEGRIENIAPVETDLPTTRLNDGRVDPAGRFVCGGMDEAEPQQPLSAVHALGRDRGVRQILGGVHCANSICWSPDGATFYFTDMPSRRIDAFDYDAAAGSIANRRTFASLKEEPGLADGSVVDADGCLWNAQWGGAKIVRYAPTGAVDREIPLPTSNPTCLAFGGPDLDILFVTTARFGLDAGTRAAQPQAGDLFAFRPGVRGRPENRYVG